MASLVNQLAAGLPDPYRPAMSVMPETPVSRAQRLAAALATPGAPGADISVDPAALLRMGGGAATYDEQGRLITADTLGQARQATLLSDNALKGLWTGNNPDSPGWANALSSGLGTAMMTSPMLGMIKAYHGSPHDFDVFSMDKIGTGEGAQAYGHGLYFAENPDVATSYKHSTSDLKDFPLSDNSGGIPSWLGKQITQYPPGHEYYNATLDEGIKQFEDRVAESQAEMASSQQPWNVKSKIASQQQILDGLKRLRAGDATLKKPGHEYEVAIDAHPDEFLDWDKPLSEQPKAKAVLEKLAGNEIGGDFQAGTIVSGLGDKRGGDPAAVSEALRAAGIKGIRYADQGSRGNKSPFYVTSNPDGTFHVSSPSLNRESPPFNTRPEAEAWIKDHNPQGTSNYVVFDDKTISILKKYGLAGLTAGGAAAAVATGNYPTEQHPQTKPPPEAWIGVRG